jgi:hypothetical protein
MGEGGLIAECGVRIGDLLTIDELWSPHSIRILNRQ